MPFPALPSRNCPVTAIAEHHQTILGPKDKFTDCRWSMNEISADFSVEAATRLPKKGPWRPERCDRVALVLQGGGALGAYQAGVYQAMHEAGIEPDWVSGVSIGAINSAIIAGNPPGRRLRALRAV